MNLSDYLKAFPEIIPEKSDCSLISREDVQRSLKESVCVNIQNVIDYMNLRQSWSVNDLVCVMPPFPNVLIESKSFFKWPGSAHFPALSYAIIIMAGDGKRKINDVAAVLFSGEKYGSQWKHVKRRAVFHYQCDDEGNLIKRYFDESFLGKLKRRLNMSEDEKNLRFNYYRVFDNDRPEDIEHLKEKMKILNIDERQVNRLNQHGINLFAAQMAFSFMNCKNVKLETLRQSGPPESVFYRNRRPPPQEPLSKVYSITIEPVKKIIAANNHGVDELTPHSFHICRGHFKDFSHGKGLFGKHRGTYWWPMLTRGNRAYGEIKKDYSIGGIDGNRN